MSLAEHFDGFEPFTAPCVGCGEPQSFASTDPERTQQRIAEGLVRPLCAACMLGEQAETMLSGDSEPEGEGTG